MPERSDSRLVHYTCRSYFDDMLAARIQIFGFKGGLLHTKSVAVDGELRFLDLSIWMSADMQIWQQRPNKERFLENLARLASPLL